jgi:hypothetical protein
MVRFIEKIDLEHVDFSFIPSLRCNIECSFCMYDCSPRNNTILDIDDARIFLETVDWQRIGSWGFYGGEVSIEMDLYQKFIDLIRPSIPKFTITNGSWTNNEITRKEFFFFAYRNGLSVIVSGTNEHKAFQNSSIVSRLSDCSGIHFKGDDDIHPMGRAAREGWKCGKKCLTHPQPIRLAMFPGGHIILQNCDGVYPVIGNYRDHFKDIFAQAVAVRRNGCHHGTFNVNDLMAGKQS